MSAAQAAWPGFGAKLLSRIKIADETMAFRFERPSGWDFQAGQFVDITLLRPPEPDAKGNVRGFSIASAPYEKTIMVACRMRDSAFKQALASMPLHSEVRMEGPFGSLAMPAAWNWVREGATRIDFAVK